MSPPPFVCYAPEGKFFLGGADNLFAPLNPWKIKSAYDGKNPGHASVHITQTCTHTHTHMRRHVRLEC